MQSTSDAFANLADSFLVCYTNANTEGASFAALFNLGHAVELYLKAAIRVIQPEKQVSTYRHSVEDMLRDIQSDRPTLLQRYQFRKDVADRWTINPKYDSESIADPDFLHFNNNIELYWIARYLKDTKYLFASHQGSLKGAHVVIAVCSLNEYWQPFFRELRAFLRGNSIELRDTLDKAACNPHTPLAARQYLLGILDEA